MSSDSKEQGARLPKQQRGRQRVAELLSAAAAVFGESGYEAATMTEIAARAGAPIGSLYQFFPSKEALADTLVRDYAALIESDLEALRARAASIGTDELIEGLFALLRGHPTERAAALPLAEARMDERTRRSTFRAMIRRAISAILRERHPRMSPEDTRTMTLVLLQLMKAVSALSDEEGLAGRADAINELKRLAAGCLNRR